MEKGETASAFLTKPAAPLSARVSARRRARSGNLERSSIDALSRAEALVARRPTLQARPSRLLVRPLSASLQPHAPEHIDRHTPRHTPRTPSLPHDWSARALSPLSLLVATTAPTTLRLALASRPDGVRLRADVQQRDRARDQLCRDDQARGGVVLLGRRPGAAQLARAPVDELVHQDRRPDPRHGHHELRHARGASPSTPSRLLSSPSTRPRVDLVLPLPLCRSSTSAVAFLGCSSTIWAGSSSTSCSRCVYFCSRSPRPPGGFVHSRPVTS